MQSTIRNLELFAIAFAFYSTGHCQTVNLGNREFGQLAEAGESANHGPTTVSSGQGDAGGVSYGTYQLSSKTDAAGSSTVQRFVDAELPGKFVGLTPGSVDFTTHWQVIVAQDPAAFASHEYKFIKATHYDPLLRGLQKEFDDDFARRSVTLQNVLFSTAVQHGSNALPLVTKAIRNGLKNAGHDRPIKSMGDQAMIGAIYSERMAVNKDGTAKYFGKSSREVQLGVLRRLASERLSASSMLVQEEVRSQELHRASSESNP